MLKGPGMVGAPNIKRYTTMAKRSLFGAQLVKNYFSSSIFFVSVYFLFELDAGRTVIW